MLDLAVGESWCNRTRRTNGFGIAEADRDGKGAAAEDGEIKPERKGKNRVHLLFALICR